MDSRSVSQFAMAGGGLVFLGQATGFLAGLFPHARAGLGAHVEGVLGGLLLLAIAGVWRRRVKLSRQGELWAFFLLVLGAYGNWLVELLAAAWGTSLLSWGTAAPHAPVAWQESTVLVLSLAVAVLLGGGMALLLRGLSAGQSHA